MIINPFFIGRLIRKKTTMDDDVIDVTHMTEEDRREHMRRLQQLTTCPCFNCTLVCDRVSIMHSCEPYQTWLDYQMPERKNTPRYAKKKRKTP